MLDARHRRCGPMTTGSRSVVSVRFGSAALATARAGISSPLGSATPTTRSFLVRICVTSAFVLIVAPTAWVADASESASAPGPPRTVVDWPAAPAFPTESERYTAVVPADHGPIAVYSTARDASAPSRAVHG